MPNPEVEIDTCDIEFNFLAMAHSVRRRLPETFRFVDRYSVKKDFISGVSLISRIIVY